MTDRPIIFSAPMVRALLGGTKTQTRRLATSPLARCKPGDRLWVRESFVIFPRSAYALPKIIAPDPDNAAYFRMDFDRSGKPLWKPSIHMPRWASRLTLHVEGVRVQRLQEISPADIEAEGVEIPVHHRSELHDPHRWRHDHFRPLWNSLHGADSWDANPEVVALTFRVVRGNIDSESV